MLPLPPHPWGVHACTQRWHLGVQVMQRHTPERIFGQRVQEFHMDNSVAFSQPPSPVWLHPEVTKIWHYFLNDFGVHLPPPPPQHEKHWLVKYRFISPALLWLSVVLRTSIFLFLLQFHFFWPLLLCQICYKRGLLEGSLHGVFCEAAKRKEST